MRAEQHRLYRAVPDSRAGRGEVRGADAQGGGIPSLFDAIPSVNFEVGQVVVHKKFGKGRITAFKDNNQQMQIDFEGVGSKWLSVAFAAPNLA